jgi:protein required for attachment to host cells
MNKTCIVVADGARARFFLIEAAETKAGSKLAEKGELKNDEHRHGNPDNIGNRDAGPVHPHGAQRERHRLELDRRFGQEIARQVAAITKGWKQGTLVLVAEPRLLGLLREPLHKALHPGVALKELAKDYTRLPSAELLEHLALNRLVPESHGDAG